MQNVEEKENVLRMWRKRKNGEHDIGKHSESLANERGNKKQQKRRKEIMGLLARWKS